MITGHVSVYREPVISVTVGGPSGGSDEIDAIVDTGFSGFLTLPAQVIQRLGLTWRRRGRAMLADGSDSLFEIFEGTVLWNRTLRRIAVDEAECHPLVGMALLQGHELTVHAVSVRACLMRVDLCPWRMKNVNARRLAGLVLLATPILAVADLAAAQDTTLLDAARAADSARVIALLEHGVSANTRQADGATALHWAAHWDDATMADALVGAGADVDVANDFGATPLWLACLNGSDAMVETLLAAGADANAALPSGETVLMTASRTGSVEAVRLLASHGADLNAREHTRGQTALMWAVAQQHPDVVKTLVGLGADVQARSAPQPRRIHTRTAGFNPSGVIDTVLGSNTPILFAARQGDLDVARHLVAAGADVNDTAATGTSALVVAAHSGHTALAFFLLEQGADPNAAEAGYTALHAATLRGDETLVAALLARGADANAPVLRGSQGRRNSPDYVLDHDVVGATAFWLAAHFAEPGIMRVLADGGANPHVVMEDGTTPLMAAVAARRRREPGLAPNPAEDERLVLEAARAAIDAGGDVNAADTAGNTALHTAAARRLDTVVRLLADSGADLHALNDNGQTR